MPDTDHNSKVSEIYATYAGIEEGAPEEKEQPAKKGDPKLVDTSDGDADDTSADPSDDKADKDDKPAAKKTAAKKKS